MRGFGAMVEAEFAFAGLTAKREEVELMAERHFTMRANGVHICSGHFGERLLVCHSGSGHVEVGLRIYRDDGLRGLEILVTRWPAACDISHLTRPCGGEEASRR